MNILFISVRWIMAAGCLYAAWRAEVKAEQVGYPIATLFLIFTMGLLIIAVLLVSPETSKKIADAFADIFVGFIYPNARFSKPPLSYTLARHYRRLHRTEEAIEEYEKIIRYYPKEKDAYVELLTLAFHAGEERVYKKYARRAKRRFRCEIEVVQPPPILVPEKDS